MATISLIEALRASSTQLRKRQSRKLAVVMHARFLRASTAAL